MDHSELIANRAKWLGHADARQVYD